MKGFRHLRAGVVLLNSGGPQSPAEVEPYIRELLSDPHMLQLPCGRLCQLPLARRLAGLRAERVQGRYQAIGGSSPVVSESLRLAAALSRRLSLPVACAMRYSSPRAPAALAALAACRVEQVVAVSLYPQYSKTTSLSSFEDFERHCPPRLAWLRVEHYGTHPGFVQSLAELVRTGLRQVQTGSAAHVLFAAHSLPLSYIRRGDPYVAQVRQTVEAVAREIGPAPAYSLAFQSKLGPLRWQGPSLAEALAALTRDGVRQLVVCPVSFVTENLETLYDLDIVFKSQCRQAGLRFIRVPTIRAAESFHSALADLVRRALKDGK